MQTANAVQKRFADMAVTLCKQMKLAVLAKLDLKEMFASTPVSVMMACTA